MSDQKLKHIIDQLKKGDQKTLEKIYLENREGFINFSRKYNIEEQDAVDIYQDAIIVLRDNAVNGRIDSLQSNISTYLFAIGKYKIYHNFRVRSREDLTEDIDLLQENLNFDVNLDPRGLTNEQKLLKRCFSELGDRCRSILELFYYQGYTLDEIQEILEYSNKKVLKSQKSRCIRQLKDLVKKYHEKS
jgi:RNA polymerase sigma factor (sigma-70 family)